jgi:PDZ domain-containing protein
MKKLFSYIVNTIKEEYKFIIVLLLLFIIFEYPLNYYIIIGGGTSDVSSRIKVEDKYESKGSFNISFVEELKGTVLTYLLSYVVPSWEREDADLYKYNDNESIDDIEFRSNLDLSYSNGNATYWAYKLANKDVEKIDSKIYVITVFDKYDTKLKIKDEILSINGNSYDSIEEYKEYLQTLKENDYVTVKVIRNKKEKEIKTKLYKYEDRLILGVGLQIVDSYKTNPKVDIKFKSSESGPSGGLITTLEIYNQLTKRDLTKGKKIAGTGTIEKDGTIGEIGGVEYKILGATEDDTDIFLVPEGNYKDAVKYKKKHNLKIKLIKVKNIEEVIEKLNNLE